MNIYLDYKYACSRSIEEIEQLNNKIMLMGYKKTNDITKADVVILFGCASREDTIMKSIESLYFANEEKNKKAEIMLFGCLSEYIKDGLEEQGIKGFASLTPLIEYLGKKQKKNIDTLKNSYVYDKTSTVAHITIGDGCENMCTFCKVHYLDKPLKSEPIEKIIKKMYDQRVLGKTFLSLSALDSSNYGKDLYGDQDNWLSKLVLAAIGMGYEAIDIEALNIAEIDDTLTKVLVESEIPIFLDIPLQHSNDLVLEKMGRKTTAKEMANKILKLKANPNLIIMSGVMVGFPYEPLESIKETFDFHRSLGIYDVNLFKYIDHVSVPSHKYKLFTDVEIERRFSLACKYTASLRYEGMKKLVGHEIPVINNNGSYVSLPFSANVEYENSKDIPNGVVKSKVLKIDGLNKFICS